ncbi:MAG: IS21 family transposase, partial [Chloroflexota bacterium]
RDALGLSRNTVAKYRAWAEEQSLLTGLLPPLAEIDARLKAAQAPALKQTTSKVEPHRVIVEDLRRRGLECQAIYQRLCDDRRYDGSYSAVWRFVAKLEGQTPEVTVRVEVGPGEESQLDFGYAGRMYDPQQQKVRKAWAFVMTLSHSRHQYVDLVFDQTVSTWTGLHRQAFEFFGGVPKKLKIDNLKAAIVKACFEDPQVQRAYRECAEHYGFLISPCRVATPQHKGKVENGIWTLTTGSRPPDIAAFWVAWDASPNGQKCEVSSILRHHNIFLGPEPFTLTINVSPAGAGIVSASVPANCPDNKYANGATLTLTANPASGNVFVNWTEASGAVLGTTNTLVVTMDADKEITANFVMPTPTPTPTVPSTLIIDLAWERSRESDTFNGGAIGAGVSAGLQLPTYPENVWDQGTWAYWPQRTAVDIRHFKATFTFPVGLDPATTQLKLYYPYYPSDAIPINDNLYVYVNGVHQFTGGTSYNAGRCCGFPTDGWYIPDGVTLTGFQADTNTIDIITEEYANWGGLGYLALRYGATNPNVTPTPTPTLTQTATPSPTATP